MMSRRFSIYSVSTFVLISAACRPGGDTNMDGSNGDADAQSIISANSDDRPQLSLDNTKRFNPLVVGKDPSKQIKFYYLNSSKSTLVVESYDRAIIRDVAGGTPQKFTRNCIVGLTDAASAYSWLQRKKAFLVSAPLGVTCPK